MDARVTSLAAGQKGLLTHPQLQEFGWSNDQIQHVLVPDVIKDDWKKWWDTAKRELKKDGHFQVPVKKSDPVIFQAEEVSLQTRLLAEFPEREGALDVRIACGAERAFGPFLDLLERILGGVPQDVEHVFSVPPAQGPLTIGQGDRDYQPTDEFIGDVAQLRSYARALTPGQVWQLYKAEAG